MSVVDIKYTELDKLVDNAKKCKNEIQSYINDIDGYVIKKASSLENGDSSGYISGAIAEASTKRNRLITQKDAFEKFGANISSFVSYAKERDMAVKTNIDQKTKEYVPERKWYEKIGDWLYETFCVDLLNSTEWLRTIGDYWKKEFTDCRIWMEENVVRFFKYGEGKYIWETIKTIGGVILGAAGVIAAVAALPEVGGAALILGFVGIAASSVTFVASLINAEAEIEGDAKAYKLFKEGKKGAAEYYSDISSLSEKYEKTDMGDADENAFYSGVGTALDTVEAVATVVEVGVNILQLGLVKDYRFSDPNKQLGGNFDEEKKVYEHASKLDFSSKNVLKNIKHDMGLKTSYDHSFKLGDNKSPSILGKNVHVQIKKEALDPFNGLYKVKNMKKLTDLGVPEWVAKSVNYYKSTKKIIKMGEAAQEILTHDYSILSSEDATMDKKLSNLGEIADPVYELSKNIKVFKPISTFKTKELIEMVGKTGTAVIYGQKAEWVGNGGR